MHSNNKLIFWLILVQILFSINIENNHKSKYHHHNNDNNLKYWLVEANPTETPSLIITTATTSSSPVYDTSYDGLSYDQQQQDYDTSQYDISDSGDSEDFDLKTENESNQMKRDRSVESTNGTDHISQPNNPYVKAGIDAFYLYHSEDSTANTNSSSFKLSQSISSGQKSKNSDQQFYDYQTSYDDDYDDGSFDDDQIAAGDRFIDEVTYAKPEKADKVNDKNHKPNIITVRSMDDDDLEDDDGGDDDYEEDRDLGSRRKKHKKKHHKHHKSHSKRHHKKKKKKHHHSKKCRGEKCKVNNLKAKDRGEDDNGFQVFDVSFDVGKWAKVEAKGKIIFKSIAGKGDKE